jgi:hypothetical protein
VIALILVLAVLVSTETGTAGPFTAKGTQPGVTHQLLDSTACATCHGNYAPAADFEPLPTWQGTMMAQATRDPLFWAALDVANNDVPGIGEFCLRCHAPAAFLAGRTEAPGGSPDGCGLVGVLDQPGGDFDGVNCQLCHRMQTNPTPPVGQSEFHLENAQWWLDDSDCNGAGEPCRHGPYSYPLDGANPPPHAWKYSLYLTGAEHCAACHNVTNPVTTLVDGGIDTGIPFPIERTYDEWAFSDMGFLDYDGSRPGLLKAPLFTTCQSCHMPESGVSPAYASSFLLNDHTGDLGVHALAGGNTWIPDVLAQAYPALGIGTSLAATRARALDQLQNHSATLAVDVAQATAEGASLPVSVTVTNLTGHKLPTGYPEGRRMWLDVEARDGDGAVIFRSGAYDAATGVLTRDAQVKVYESKQGVWDAGTQTCVTEDGTGELFHFAKNDCVALDNRIPPIGFRGDAETRPVGYVYPEASAGKLVNYDVTTYGIPVPPGTLSPIVITAKLRYQTTSKEYVEFLLREAATEGFADDCLPRQAGLPGKTRAEILHDYWQAYDRSPPVDMEVAAAVVAVEPIDAFTCYKAKPSPGTPGFVSRSGVGATSAFDATDVDVKSPRLLCGAADSGGGTGDAATKLLAYKAVQSAGSPRHTSRSVSVEDAYGTHAVDTVKVELLARAAATSPAPPPPAPPGGTAVGDYLCYKVKGTQGAPKFGGAMRALGDALDPALRTLRVVKPRLLCLPADAGTPPAHPDAALLCYVAKGAPESAAHTPLAGVQVSDPFGPLSLRTVREKLFCLPARVTP